MFIFHWFIAKWTYRIQLQITYTIKRLWKHIILPAVYHNIINQDVIGRVESSVKITSSLYYYCTRFTTKRKKKSIIESHDLKKYKINNRQKYVQIKNSSDKMIEKIMYTCSRVVRLYIQSYPAAVSWRRPTTVEHISPEPANYYWGLERRWATAATGEGNGGDDWERKRERVRERDSMVHYSVRIKKKIKKL